MEDTSEFINHVGSRLPHAIQCAVELSSALFPNIDTRASGLLTDNSLQAAFNALDEDAKKLVAQAANNPICTTFVHAPTAASAIKKTVIAFAIKALSGQLRFHATHLESRVALEDILLSFLGCELQPALICKGSNVKKSSSQRKKGTCSLNPMHPHSLVITDLAEQEARQLRVRYPGLHTVRSSFEELMAFVRRQNGETANKKWLTIVIPAMGQAELQQALKSVFAQNSTEVEVLIINGGSTPLNLHHPLNPPDSAPNDTSQLSPTPSCYNVWSVDDSPYDAMNLGVLLANTDWVYFMGEDDELASPAVIEHLQTLAASVDENCNLIYGNVRMSGDLPGSYDGQIHGYPFSYERLAKQNIGHQGCIYRTSALRKLGGYRTQYPIYADWDLNIRLWNRGDTLFTDTVIANFSRGGISSQSGDAAFIRDLPQIWRANIAK